MSSPRVSAAVTALSLALASAQASAQLTSSLSSFRRARQVLDQAIVAHGGLERLRGIDVLTVRHEGQFFNRNQSRRVAPPYDATPANGMLVYDRRGGRLAFETETGFPGGFRNQSRIVLLGREGWNLNLREHRWVTAPDPVAANQRGVLRRFPHYLLLSALDRGNQLRSLGRATWHGRSQDVITYAADDGVQLTLYIDAATHLVSKLDQVYTDPLTGDALGEFVFPGYRELNGVQMPTGRRIVRVGELIEDAKYTDVTVNGAIPEQLFTKPADFADGNGAPPADTTVATLGDGVYLLGGVGGSNSVFVDFADYVLVIEPYGNDAASKRSIAKIKATVAGKPIRYIVPTHHHDDHTGGLRTYVAEGATVVTTPGNREYVERMARATYTLLPDAQATRQAPSRVEVIEGKKRVFTDGTRTVEIIDIGPSPHAAEMLVAYFPKEQIVVQGDLLNLPTDGRVPAGTETTAYFAEWLARSGLAVSRIVGVHGPPATPAQLTEAVTKLRGERP
ncbi:MAG: MBL fold metallo-hydrolase [Gemmatimonadota bacterium]